MPEDAKEDVLDQLTMAVGQYLTGMTDMVWSSGFQKLTTTIYNDQPSIPIPCCVRCELQTPITDLQIPAETFKQHNSSYALSLADCLSPPKASLLKLFHTIKMDLRVYKSK